MHIKPETTSSAAEAATEEAKTWIDLSNQWQADAHFHVWADVPGSELAVIALYDPAKDLGRRMASWSYPVADLDFSDVACFASGLAQAESDAWANDQPHVATRAYAERRFLVGDRILHWAIPWFDAIERSHPDRAHDASDTKAQLLAIGDRMRPAPALTGSEGLVVPGFDGYGPLTPDVPLNEFLLSLWSGSLLTRGDIASSRNSHVDHRYLHSDWLKDPELRSGLTNHYNRAALRWESMAVVHPGTAQLWLDLASRARNTARWMAT